MSNRPNPNSRKRAATNVVMFVGIAALALVAWYDVNGKLPSRQNTRLQYAVSTLTLVRQDGVTFAFERDGNGWFMQQPVRVSAIDTRVAMLAELIDSDTSAAYHISEINLSATGLDTPRIRMRIGQDTAIFFGATEPLSGRRYVQINDEVLLLEDQHVPLVEGGLNAFADRAPLNASIESVTVQGEAHDAIAWKNLKALGIRAHDVAIPNQAKSVEINTATETQAWHAWRDDALVALHREGSDIHYLISEADAATLGLTL